MSVIMFLSPSFRVSVTFNVKEFPRVSIRDRTSPLSTFFPAVGSVFINPRHRFEKSWELLVTSVIANSRRLRFQSHSKGFRVTREFWPNFRHSPLPTIWIHRTNLVIDITALRCCYKIAFTYEIKVCEQKTRFNVYNLLPTSSVLTLLLYVWTVVSGGFILIHLYVSLDAGTEITIPKPYFHAL